MKNNANRSKKNGGQGVQENGKGEALGLQSLERLRIRIESAAEEIRRLRKENVALADRIAGMESDKQQVEGTLLHLDEDPEMLREKISTFIEALDKYMAEQDTRPSA